MAWPKPRNRRSPVPVETSSNGGGGAAEGAKPHAVAPDQAGRPSWPSPERWPSAHATVAPVPVEAQLSAEEASESGPTDPGDRPFWESWGRADEAADLDEPGDGLGRTGPRTTRSRTSTRGPGDPGNPWSPPWARPANSRRPRASASTWAAWRTCPANPRMRAWRRRVIVAVIAGVLFGFLLHDWRVGADLRRAGRHRRHHHPVADGVQRPGGRPADQGPEAHRAAAVQPGAQGLPGHAHPAHPGQRGADRPPGDRPGGRVRHRLRGLGQADAGADQQPPAAVARADAA